MPDSEKTGHDQSCLKPGYIVPNHMSVCQKVLSRRGPDSARLSLLRGAYRFFRLQPQSQRSSTCGDTVVSVEVGLSWLQVLAKFLKFTTALYQIGHRMLWRLLTSSFYLPVNHVRITAAEGRIALDLLEFIALLRALESLGITASA